MIDNISDSKSFMLCILGDSKEESHIAINSNEHYTFEDCIFYDNADDCMEAYINILNNGGIAVVINMEKVKHIILRDKIEKMKLAIGIDHIDFDVKQ